MEVLNENAALLCNSEVLALLRSLKYDKKRAKNILQNLSEKNKTLTDKEKSLQRLNTIIYETVKYLEQSPSATQTPESVGNFLKAISGFNLKKAEKLQLLNHRPTTLVEIQVLIEESEERLTEEQMEEILEIVAKTLPPGPESEDVQIMEADEDRN